MDQPRLVSSIDLTESNYSLGDHRTWPRADREAWHKWAARETGEPHPIEQCDCWTED